MFLTTFFVRFSVARLYASGMIDKQQMDGLIEKEKTINTLTTTVLAIALLGYLYSKYTI